MIDKVYDEKAVIAAIKAKFGLDLDIIQFIVFHVPISHTAWATLFLTSKKHLYLYVFGESKLTLGDIRKVVSRMGLVADNYVPPVMKPQYFEEAAKQKFQEVFPGRKVVTSDDLAFYRTLVPYNPALIQISEVKDGIIHQFDSDSNTNWRVAAKFAYRRIRTS